MVRWTQRSTSDVRSPNDPAASYALAPYRFFHFWSGAYRALHELAQPSDPGILNP